MLMGLVDDCVVLLCDVVLLCVVHVRCFHYVNFVWSVEKLDVLFDTVMADVVE
jgi:hypothetical protein